MHFTSVPFTAFRHSGRAAVLRAPVCTQRLSPLLSCRITPQRACAKEAEKKHTSTLFLSPAHSSSGCSRPRMFAFPRRRRERTPRIAAERGGAHRILPLSEQCRRTTVPPPLFGAARPSLHAQILNGARVRKRAVSRQHSSVRIGSPPRAHAAKWSLLCAQGSTIGLLAANARCVPLRSPKCFVSEYRMIQQHTRESRVPRLRYFSSSRLGEAALRWPRLNLEWQ